MDTIMPAIYNMVESVHFFIPVLAIVSCLVIFACSTMGSSTKNQPPEEYLKEIRSSKHNMAKSLKNKAQKSSKVTQPISKQHSPTVDRKDYDNSPKKLLDGHEERIVRNGEEMGQKSKKKKGDQRHQLGQKSNDDWVTVVSSKNKKNQPQVPTAVERPKPVEKSVKKSTSSDSFSMSDENYPPMPSMEDSPPMFGGKDSRYKKQNKQSRKAGEKVGAENLEATVIQPTKDEFVAVQSARKRKNVRREN